MSDCKPISTPMDANAKLSRNSSSTRENCSSLGGSQAGVAIPQGDPGLRHFIQLIKGRTLKGYVDADWANCTDDRRSYMGYAFMLANGVISWESRKQRTVAFSSTKAEYIGITDTTKEAVYLQRFLKELGFDPLTDVTILCNNMRSLKLASNPVFHSCTKHIDIRHHYGREVLSAGLINLKYTPTEGMAADMLTKGLPNFKHIKYSQTVGIRHLYA